MATTWQLLSSVHQTPPGPLLSSSSSQAYSHAPPPSRVPLLQSPQAYRDASSSSVIRRSNARHERRDNPMQARSYGANRGGSSVRGARGGYGSGSMAQRPVTPNLESVSTSSVVHPNRNVAATVTTLVPQYTAPKIQHPYTPPKMHYAPPQHHQPHQHHQQQRPQQYRQHYQQPPHQQQPPLLATPPAPAMPMRHSLLVNRRVEIPNFRGRGRGGQRARGRGRGRGRGAHSNKNNSTNNNNMVPMSPHKPEGVMTPHAPYNTSEFLFDRSSSPSPALPRTIRRSPSPAALSPNVTPIFPSSPAHPGFPEYGSMDAFDSDLEPDEDEEQ